MADPFSKTKAPVAVLEYEPSAFEQVLLKHKSKLILVAVLAVGGSVAYWGWKLIKEAGDKSAAVAYTRAETVAQLKEAASKYSGKPAGGSALVEAAAKLSTEKPAEAITMLRDFLSAHPQHPLRDLASYRIAEYLLASGDTAAAEREYETISKAGTAFSPMALLRLGDLKWGAGDTEKAKDYYNTILNTQAMASSPARTDAQSRMDRALKVKPPVLVEYKEEPPPPPPGGNFDNIGLGDINSSPGDGFLPPPQLPQPQLPPAPAPAPPPAPAETPSSAPAVPPPPADDKPASPAGDKPAENAKPAPTK
jgi:predicted negative regulator of RcsB-dependent stress response